MDKALQSESPVLKDDNQTCAPAVSPRLPNPGVEVNPALPKREIWDQEQTECIAVIWRGSNKSYVEVRSDLLRGILKQCGLASDNCLPSSEKLHGYLSGLESHRKDSPEHEKILSPFIEWLKSASQFYDPMFWDGTEDDNEDPTMR